MAEDVNSLVDTLKGLLDNGGAEKLSELFSSKENEGAVKPSSGGFDLENIMKIKNAYDKINSGPDPRVSLLNSLRPYLNDVRAARLDSIVKLLNLTKISDLLKEMKGGL